MPGPAVPGDIAWHKAAAETGLVGMAGVLDDFECLPPASVLVNVIKPME